MRENCKLREKENAQTQSFGNIKVASKITITNYFQLFWSLYEENDTTCE